MPEVTIITPTWQASNDKLWRCLTSVRRQTFRDYEHIVCSDGAYEEKPAAFVMQQADARISYTTTALRGQDWGHSVRRALLPLARGHYVCFLDDDNYIFPTYLEKMLAALKSDPKAAFAICAILHHGPIIAELGVPPIVLPGEPKKFYIDTLQVMAETSVMQAIGWRGNSYAADGETYEALGKAYNYVRVPEVLGVHS